MEKICKKVVNATLFSSTNIKNSYRVRSSLQYCRGRRPRGGPPVRGAAAGVLLGVQEDDVHLGHEEAEEVNRRAQYHAHAQARNLNLECVNRKCKRFKVNTRKAT